MSLKEEIAKFFKGEILTDEENLKKYSRDASLFEIKPQLVVAPQDVDDVKNLVKFASKNKEPGVSLTARSAGTDMTGGPLTESIVLDFTKYFNHIKNIRSCDDLNFGGEAVVEPGVYYRDFEKETLKHNLLLPSYPASREICAIGGMVANNSGGEKTLAYGKTDKYVQELKAVLSDGNEYLIRPLNQEELKLKLAQDDFEGMTYQKLHKLIIENWKLIVDARPRVSKNSAGYNLWDIWNGQIFDLTKLLVGSQGTLGLITEVKFKLVKPKLHSKLLVILLPDFKKLVEVVHAVLPHQPESFEFFDDHTMKLGIRYFFWRFAIKFLPELWLVVTGGLPKMVLLAEFTGDSEKEVAEKIKTAQVAVAQLGVKTRVTSDDQDTQKYWTLRRESFNLLRTKIKNRKTAPFIDDLIVLPEKLSAFFPRLNALLEQYPSIIYTLAGHIGDGNIHVIPLVDLNDAKERAAISEILNKVNQLVFEFGGSMTAEHNDGLIRSPFLPQMFGEAMFALFKEVKMIFDPQQIFNPGKKVGANLDYAFSYIKKTI